MKILFLTNFYPPYVIGGYEALCLETVEGLTGRGHETLVLTSMHGVNRPVTEGRVYRLLSLEGDLQFYRPRDAWSYPIRNRRNLTHLRNLIAAEKPDIVFIWGMWNLSKRLAQEAECLMGSRVAYYLANPWPIESNMHQAYWDAPATSRTRMVFKRLLRILARIWLADEWRDIPLRFEHAPCCSAAQRDQLLQAGVPLKDAPVIYEGVDLTNYLVHACQRTHTRADGSLALLFVGILAEHKGVHTTIEALAQLSHTDRRQVHLTILGAGHRQYEEHLHDLVERFQLCESVTFHTPIPRSQLPALLAKFDVLLLPSIWPEPLARIMQEGLASGMVVIGSATGGTAETINPGENGLLFQAGDAIDLAKQITYLLDHPQMCSVLAEGGVRTAKERFDINVMLKNIENYLEQVYARVR